MLIEHSPVFARVNHSSGDLSTLLIIVGLIAIGYFIGNFINRSRKKKAAQTPEEKLNSNTTGATVTSQSVVNKRFTPTKFSEGYDQDEVDDFLDLVTQEFRRLEAGLETKSALATNPNLTPEDVVNKRFQPTKFREGYDQDQVDDYLDEIVVALRYLASEQERLQGEKLGNEASRDI